MIRYCSTVIVNPPSSLGLDGVSPIHNPGHPFRVNISPLSSIRITSSPNGLLVILIPLRGEILTLDGCPNMRDLHHLDLDY